jgi:D-arabinose 1-dehydrogenase-like Zn-dependent alcohol dehydrogenase
VRVAVLRAFREPLKLAEVPDPKLRDGDVLVEVRAVGLCGTDLKIKASGTRGRLEGLVARVRPGARLVTNGYRPGVEYGVDSSALDLHELTIMGSRAGRREDARGAPRAVQDGMVKPLISQTRPLAEMNRALNQVRAGEVFGRVVVNP